MACEGIKLTFVLLTSNPVSKIPPIKIWREENGQLLSDRCKLVYRDQKPRNISIQLFELYYRFFYSFSADQYEQPYQEETFKKSFKQLFIPQSSNKRNYFWLPCSEKSQIDQQLIINYFKFKQNPLDKQYNLWETMKTNFKEISLSEDFVDKVLKPENKFLKEFPFISEKQINSK